mmetsp:Transcript_26574/g.55687  ORF Transcript_26574/g.55687 Transcript_26574/m.55687 type:complete len:223 (+) Transcript_26574:398-1066(+)
MLHHESNTLLVNCLERIIIEDADFKVLRNESIRVVARNTHGHLGQIVRTIRKEVTEWLSIGIILQIRNLVRNDCCPWHLDHCSDLILDIDSAFGTNAFSFTFDDEGLILVLIDGSDEGNHNAGVGVSNSWCFLHEISCGTDDGLCLHLGKLGLHNTQSATTQSEHRVFFVHGIHPCKHSLYIFSESKFFGNLFVNLLWTRQELMKWRIEETDGDMHIVHCLE